MNITKRSADLSSFTGILRKLLLGFALCVSLNIAAQEQGAKVYRLDGQSFAISAGGERSVFTAETVKNRGVNLERSGIVHTGPGTFLEIQLLPSGTVIKMSENTSLVYNGIDSTGGFVDLGLLYGRIRVVSGDGLGAGPVVIRSGGISSRVEAGDFGADYILEPGDRNSVPRPFFRFHAFRGKADVFPYGRGGSQPYFSGAQTVNVKEGESLALDISSSYTFVEKKPISDETLNYWMINGFAGASPLPAPAAKIETVQEAPVELTVAAPPPLPAQAPILTVTPVAPAAPITPVIPVAPVAIEVFQPEEITPQHLPSKTSFNRVKTTSLVIGLAMTFAAVAVQGFTYYKYDVYNDRTANTVFNTMHIPLGVGILTTLGGILYNPSPGKR